MRNGSLCLLLLFLGFSEIVKGQDSTATEIKETFILPTWFSLMPSKFDTVKGLSASWGYGDIDTDHYSLDSDQACVVINGMHTYISPIQLFAVVMVIVNLPFTEIATFQDDYVEYWTTQDGEINGCSISLWERGKSISIRGMQISLIAHHFESMNGLSIGGIYSQYDTFRGTMISSIRNKAGEGRGVQIGLLNKSESLKGLQIGLWNKIGNRGFPLINIGF